MVDSRLPKPRTASTARVSKKIHGRTASALDRAEAPLSNSGESFENRDGSDVIVVLGMHRSGTSAVAGTLMKLGGASPTHLMVENPINSRGFFESVAFMGFHDDLLASAGSHWDDWRMFNPEWHNSSVALEYRRRAKDLFEAEFRGAPLPVLKDPRICRFALFWLEVLREMQKAPRIVIPIRSPLEVARSLKKAYGLPLTKGLLLWLRHVLDAEVQSRAEVRSIFTWNEFRLDWQGVCDKISVNTGISWPHLSDRTSREIDNFLTEDLVHHETDHAALAAHSDVNGWTLRAYEALLELARNPASHSAFHTLDQVRAGLDQSSKFFGRILLDYEIDLEDLRGQLHALTSERDLMSVRQSEILAESATLSETLAVTVAERDAMSEERERIDGELRSRQQEERQRSAEQTDRLADLERRHNSALMEQAAKASETLAAIVAERDAVSEERKRIAGELRSRQQELAEKAAVLVDMVEREKSASTELAAGQKVHEAQLRALRDQLIDAEAALSNARAKRSRTGIGAMLLPASSPRRRLARRLIGAGLLDPSWYAAKYPDAAEGGLGPAEHYLETGFCRGYRPNPFFDTRWYLDHYEDVRRSGVNPLLHYLISGWREGRNPGPDFHTDFYLDDNPDVRANGMNPLAHYLRFGRHEGRLPAPPR